MSISVFDSFSHDMQDPFFADLFLQSFEKLCLIVLSIAKFELLYFERLCSLDKLPEYHRIDTLRTVVVICMIATISFLDKTIIIHKWASKEFFKSWFTSIGSHKMRGEKINNLTLIVRWSYQSRHDRSGRCGILQ